MIISLQDSNKWEEEDSGVIVQIKFITSRLNIQRCIAFCTKLSTVVPRHLAVLKVPRRYQVNTEVHLYQSVNNGARAAVLLTVLLMYHVNTEVPKHLAVFEGAW